MSIPKHQFDVWVRSDSITHLQIYFIIIFYWLQLQLHRFNSDAWNYFNAENSTD